MSDLRALIRLKEKELRCLEWGLMAQKAQEAAGGGLVAENLKEELDECKTEQQVGQTPSSRVGQSQGELNREWAGRGSTVADQIQIWVLHMGNQSPPKAESLQAGRYFRFTRSSAGPSCRRSIDSLLTAHLRLRWGTRANSDRLEQLSGLPGLRLHRTSSTVAFV